MVVVVEAKGVELDVDAIVVAVTQFTPISFLSWKLYNELEF